NFSGEFAGAFQSGSATIRFGASPPGFNIQSRFSNLDLSLLTKGSLAWSNFFSGKVSGTLRLAGAGGNLSEILDHLGGSGEAAGSNIELAGIDLIRNVEGKNEGSTEIAALSTKFQIAKREVRILDLEMTPAPSSRTNLRAMALSATGRV